MRQVIPASLPQLIRKCFLFAIVCCLQLEATQAMGAATERLAEQRQTFVAARKALGDNRQKEYQRLKRSLKSYPLYGYLDYFELRKQLDQATPRQITRFLDTYRDWPIADRLYTAWLHQLGKTKQWHTFLQHYKPQKSVTLQCYQLRAKLQEKPATRKQTLKKGLSLWLVGKSQPDACDEVFRQLDKAGMLTRNHRWERIRRAFAHNKTSLARHIAKPLSDNDRQWVERWVQMHKKPHQTLSANWVSLDSGLVREIVVHGLKRLARHNQEQAWQHWQQLSKKLPFSDHDRNEIIHDIALFAALNDQPRAAEWLAAVPGAAVDANIRRWRIRNALLNRDWKSALVWIDVLEPAQHDSHEWQYWRATALNELGEQAQANAAYERLSGERNFYSFLAADHIHAPYRMGHDKQTVDEQALQKLAHSAGMVRAHELMLAGMSIEARREWRNAIAGFDKQQLKLAAALADRWGWHDRAIATAAKARYWSDLDLRFPMSHLELIENNAKRYRIDPALIYGVIRQESAFMEDARSHTGALGLMQLMPGTARLTSKSLGIRYPGKPRLLQAEDNIHIGTAYLRKMLDRYNDSPVLAAAAYNAGPHRVSRWLPREHTLPAALWLLRIPFRETHGYVQRVLAYATVFDWRQQRPTIRLSARMPDVDPAPDGQNVKTSKR